MNTASGVDEYLNEVGSWRRFLLAVLTPVAFADGRDEPLKLVACRDRDGGLNDLHSPNPIGRIREHEAKVDGVVKYVVKKLSSCAMV